MNPYYNHGSFPTTGSPATSASMRSELQLIADGFDKLPSLTSVANQLVVVNSGSTALTTTTTLPAVSAVDADFTIQDNADSTRKFRFEATNITAGATRVLTVPDADLTLVGVATTQTLTNKTLTSPTITSPTISSPTITGTIAGESLTLSGNTTIGDASADSLTVNAAASFASTLAVTGAATLSSTLALTGNFAINTNKFSVAASSGNTAVAGTLAVTGTSTFTGAVTLSANPVVDAGTANGVTYLNGSKVLTSGSALTFDGTTLTAAADANRSLQITQYGTYSMRIQNPSTDAGALIDYSTKGTHSWTLNGSEQMRLTSTGLGIGTSSPGAKLQVNSGDIRIVQTNNSANNGLYFRNSADSGTFAKVAYDAARGELQVGTTQAYSLLLQTNGTTQATLDASGNLGLGVTPSAFSFTGAMQTVDGGVWGTKGENAHFTANSYYNAGWKYAISAAKATLYSQGAGAHQWYTAPSGTAGNAITFTQAMTLDASGNLGIGTSSPALPLHVYNSGAALAYFESTSANGPYVIWRSSGTSIGDVGSGKGISGAGNATDFMIASRSTYPLLFGTGSAEKMRLDSSGNLGLGVTPSGWYTPNSFRAIQLTNSASVHGQLAGGTFLTGVSSNWYANSAGTDTYIAAGYASQYRQWNGAHSWHTAPSGTAGDPITFTQAMTLDASGNFGIGVTDPSNYGKLVANGYVAFTIPSNFAGASGNASWNTGFASTSINTSIWASNSIVGGQIYTYSDARLKQNIAAVKPADALEFVMRAEPVEFDWKEDGQHDTGYVAQWLLKKGYGHLVSAVPDAAVQEEVDEDGNVSPAGARFTVKYDSIVPILHAAIKQQQEIIEQLKARLDAANL